MFTNNDMHLLLRMGWTGCMHDSDCACTTEMQNADTKVFDRFEAGERPSLRDAINTDEFACTYPLGFGPIFIPRLRR